MTDGMNITATPSLHQMTACIREGGRAPSSCPDQRRLPGRFRGKRRRHWRGFCWKPVFPGCFSAPLMRNGTMKQDGRPRHIVSGTGSRRCLKV